MIRALTYAAFEAGCIGFFLWVSYFIAHIAVGAA
jgi:hypothetical protein